MTRKQLLTTRGGNNEREPGRVVVDPSLLFNGRRFWRRPFRAHRGGADLERFTAILLFDHPTRYRRTRCRILPTIRCWPTMVSRRKNDLTKGFPELQAIQQSQQSSTTNYEFLVPFKKLGLGFDLRMNCTMFPNRCFFRH